jgi:hypothetical protein
METRGAIETRSSSSSRLSACGGKADVPRGLARCGLVDVGEAHSLLAANLIVGW